MLLIKTRFFPPRETHCTCYPAFQLLQRKPPPDPGQQGLRLSEPPGPAARRPRGEGEGRALPAPAICTGRGPKGRVRAGPGKWRRADGGHRLPLKRSSCCGSRLRTCSAFAMLLVAAATAAGRGGAGALSRRGARPGGRGDAARGGAGGGAMQHGGVGRPLTSLLTGAPRAGPAAAPRPRGVHRRGCTPKKTGVPPSGPKCTRAI